MKILRKFITKIRAFGSEWGLFNNQRREEQLLLMLAGEEERKAGRSTITPSEIAIYSSRKTFIFNLITTIGSLLVALATLGAVLISYQQNKRDAADLEVRTRPYLVIRAISHSKLETSSPAYREGESTEKYTIYIKNVGVLPAKVFATKLNCEPKGVVSATLNSFGKAVIGNGEEGEYVLIARKGKETSCDYLVQYDAPFASSSTPLYETKYQLYLYSDLIMLPEQVWMR